MSATEWRRVSPMAIIYFLLKSLRQAINLWPALVPLVAGGEQFRTTFLSYGLPGLGLIFVATVLLHFWFFRFRVEEDRLQLHTGVLNRKRLTLDFERVQQADIAQPFYFRPFGLATLGLESAGSRQQEVDIPGLSYTLAQELKDRILEYQRASTPAAPAASVLDRERAPDYELRLTWQEVARYGLMFNGLIFLAPALAPVMDNLAPSAEQWIAGLEGTRAQQLFVNMSGSGLAWLMAVITAVLLLAAILLFFAASVVIALWRFWDYRLTRRGDQFQYRAGLGTVKTRGFRAHKLQLVTISQGMLARLLRRYSLAISKVGATAPGGEGQDTRRFLVPVLDAGRLAELKRQLGLPSAEWHRVSPLFIPLRCSLLGTTASALIIIPFAHHEWLALYLASAWLLCLLAVWQYWRRLATSVDGDWLALRHGFVGQKQRWMPLAKMQKVSVSEPPWLKAWSLATRWSGLQTADCIFPAYRVRGPRPSVIEACIALSHSADPGFDFCVRDLVDGIRYSPLPVVRSK